MKTVNFSVKTDEFGYKEIEAKVKNDTEAEYQNFSIEVQYLDKDREVMGTDTAFTENQSPGKTAVFELSTDLDYDTIKVKDQEYY